MRRTDAVMLKTNVIPPITIEILERMADKFIVDGFGCWLWLGAINTAKRGQITIKGKAYATHRVMYTATRGAIEPGLVVDHLCEVPRCMNPNHLQVVTQRHNVLRSNGITANNHRKTHCKRGHEFTENNTRMKGDKRSCITCEKAYKVEYSRINRKRINAYALAWQKAKKERITS